MNFLILFPDQLTPLSKTLIPLDKCLTVYPLKHAGVFVSQDSHKKKLLFLYTAQAVFIDTLRKSSFIQVCEQSLEEAHQQTDPYGHLKSTLKKLKPQTVYAFEPAEVPMRQALKQLEQSLAISIEILADPKFVIDQPTFTDWYRQQNSPLMENFYRKVRLKTGILLDANNKPLGGKWNYDHSNRHALPKSVTVPKNFSVTGDQKHLKAVAQFINDSFPKNLGSTDQFSLPVTPQAAGKALTYFIEHKLCNFGPYQDAMTSDEITLFHSLLAPLINVGLLCPLYVCQKVEKAYHEGLAPLSSVEGFIRQILGWREFVRGIYWQEMPDYKAKNFFNHTRSLPDFYWTGQTQMNCLAHSIKQTLEHSYAHHIQRLMITGNYALLIGADPAAVNKWYYDVYHDAFEWVQLPNTHGMSQYADGGLMSTKPYVSSGNYIHKMSNYCKKCHYKVTKKEGKDACPFNYLYWNFLAKNKEKLRKNLRLKMPYTLLERMSDEKISQIAADAAAHLKDL